MGFRCCFLWLPRAQQLVPLRINRTVQHRSRVPRLPRSHLRRRRLPTPAVKHPIPTLNRTRIQNGFWASFPTSSPRMTSRKTKRSLLLEKNTFWRTIRRSISAPTSETRFRLLSNRRVMGSLTMDKGGALRPAIRGSGSGPGHVGFFHIWLFAACVERRSPLLPKEIWFTVVPHPLRSHAHGDHAHGCWWTNF